MELSNSYGLHDGVCTTCERREAELRKWQDEVKSLKEEIAILINGASELRAKLADMSTQSENALHVKEEIIRNLELSLVMEQEARSVADADLRTKTEECLSLLNSLEMLSTGTKGKEELHKELIEKLRLELLEKYEKIKKNEETISALRDARSSAVEISASLQETVTSLSEQLKRVVLEKEKAEMMHENAEAQLVKCSAKIEELTKQLEDSKNVGHDVLTKETIERLTAEIEDLTQKLLEAEQKHHSTVADLITMQDNQNQFVEILTKKVEVLKQEKIECSVERDRFKADIESLKKEMWRTKSLKEDERSALKSQIDELNNKIIEMASTQEHQCEVVDELTNKLEQYKKEKAEWESEEGSLKAQLRTLDVKLSTRDHEFEKQKTADQFRIEELSNEKNRLSDQLRAANDSLTTSQTKINFLEQAVVELQQNHEKQLETIRKEFSEHSERNRATLEEQLHKKQEDFHSAMEKIRMLTEEKVTTDSELAKLQEKLEQKQNEVVSLRMTIANTSSLYKQATEKISILEQQLECQEHNLSGITASLAEKQNRAVLMENKMVTEKNEGTVTTSAPSSTRRQSFDKSFQNSLSDDQKPRRPRIRDDSAEVEERWRNDNCDTTGDLQSEDGSSSFLNTSIAESSQNSNPQNVEYCEFCAVSGHDTFNCSTFHLQRKAHLKFRRV